VVLDLSCGPGGALIRVSNRSAEAGTVVNAH
jgi:hypothetical protein